jgi:hypothetical protein
MTMVLYAEYVRAAYAITFAGLAAAIAVTWIAWRKAKNALLRAKGKLP